MGNRHSYGYPGGVTIEDNFPGYDEKKLITREMWGAAPPDRECDPLKHPITKVRYGYTSTRMCYSKEDCSKLVREIQQINLDLGCPDIVHNFLVGSDGNIYEGRGWFKESCIPQGKSELKGKTLDVALIGPFDERKVPENMINTAITIANYGMKHKYVTDPYDGCRYEESDDEIDSDVL